MGGNHLTIPFQLFDGIKEIVFSTFTSWFDWTQSFFRQLFNVFFYQFIYKKHITILLLKFQFFTMSKRRQKKEIEKPRKHKLKRNLYNQLE